MLNIRYLLLCLCVGLALPLLGSGPVSAAKPDRIDKLFKFLDQDSSGRISRTDYRFMSVALFDELDRNDNDVLDRTELPNVGKDVFDAADRDKSGALSLSEFFDADFAKFDRIDLNKNGSIGPQEIRKYIKNLR